MFLFHWGLDNCSSEGSAVCSFPGSLEVCLWWKACKTNSWHLIGFNQQLMTCCECHVNTDMVSGFRVGLLALWPPCFFWWWWWFMNFRCCQSERSKIYGPIISNGPPKNQQPNTPQGWKALDLACFTLGISACGRSSQWERAKQLFASIGEIGFQPNPISCVAVWRRKCSDNKGFLAGWGFPEQNLLRRSMRTHTHIHTQKNL